MRRVTLLPVGDVKSAILEALSADLDSALHLDCPILPESMNPAFARHGERGQYHSSEILARMRAFHAQLMEGADRNASPWRLLGVTSVDLYIPILTFVFGEAELGGGCALISTHRLEQQFYGLPPSAPLERARILKEAVHELGHTFQLTHCEDYRCAMAPSHSVEWIDVKESRFCEECSARIFVRH